ncbi:type II secretion system (T2SS), F family protein, partial [Vibrio parahaemolyticus V-223/04]
NCWFLPFHWK